MEFLTDFEKVIVDRDLAKWKAFVVQVGLLAPSGWLGKGPGIEQQPLIDAMGPLLDGLSADEVPAADSQYLYLLMQRLMHLTARYFLDGGEDGFNGTFCDGFSRMVRPGEERHEFDLFVETIFCHVNA